MDLPTVGDFIEWVKYFYNILMELIALISGDKNEEDTTQVAD